MRAASGGRAVVYDREGDAYDTISAFIKSLRASDPDAAIYYLAVMIAGGEDPRFIARRLIVAASEDVGNADPRALEVAVAARAVEFVGLPEARINLAQATTYIALAPKSNASYAAINAAQALVEREGARRPPLALRDAGANARNLGHEEVPLPTSPDRCSTSRSCPRGWRRHPSSIPPIAGPRASCRRACASCAAGRGEAEAGEQPF